MENVWSPWHVVRVLFCEMCIYIYIHTHTHTYIHIYVCVYISVYICVKIFIYLVSYLGLCWVFVAAHGLSLVAASGGYSLLQCAGFSLRWLLLLRSTGSRHAGFSSCGM